MNVLVLIWIICFPINLGFTAWDAHKEGHNWSIWTFFAHVFWCAIMGPVMTILIPIHLAFYTYPKPDEPDLPWLDEDSSW